VGTTSLSYPNGLLLRKRPRTPTGVPRPTPLYPTRPVPPPRPGTPFSFPPPSPPAVRGMSQRLPSATPTPRPAAAVDEPLLAALTDFALKGSSFKAPLLRKLDERARGTPTPAAAATPEELYWLFKSIKTVRPERAVWGGPRVGTYAAAARSDTRR